MTLVIDIEELTQLFVGFDVQQNAKKTNKGFVEANGSPMKRKEESSGKN